MAKKQRKDSRRDKRLERQAQRASELAARQRSARRRKWALVVVAVVTAAGALGGYQAGMSRAWTGMLLLIGCGVWLAIGLGGLGAAQKPRDRTKAGNIDYGR